MCVLDNALLKSGSYRVHLKNKFKEQKMSLCKASLSTKVVVGKRTLHCLRTCSRHNSCTAVEAQRHGLWHGLVFPMKGTNPDIKSR